MREKIQVLVVDDNLKNRELVRDVLGQKNYEVHEAKNGQEALEIAPILMPNIILLDVLMPMMNGFETCERLRQTACKETPIIFLTALADAETIRKAFALGADYIHIPIHNSELLARIEAQLEKHRLLDTLQAKNTELEITYKSLSQQAQSDNERLNLALETTGVGIWEWNIQTDSIYWSSQVMDLFGVDETSFDGRYESYLKMTHPEDREKVQNAVDKSLQNPQIKYFVEHRLIRPDGEQRWLEAHGHVMSDEAGQATRMLGTVYDVTDEKLEAYVLQSAQELLQTQTETLMTLNEITNSLYQTLSTYDLAVRSIQACCDFLGADSGAFYLLEGDLLRRVETLNVSDELRAAGETLSLEGTLTGQTVLKREMIISHYVEEDKRFESNIHPLLIQKGIKSLVSIPLSHNEKILGAMNLGFTHFIPLEGDTSATLETIGKTIGLALSHAASLEQLQREVAEREKAERLQKVIFEISRATSRTASLQELLGEVRQLLGQLLDSENFFVALYDEHKDIYSFPYWADKYDKEDWIPQALKGSLTDYVRRNGKAIIINFEKGQELINSREIELIGPDSRSWLGAPLKILGKVIGVLVVQSYDNNNAYGQAELEVLRYVGENIAWVIENKRIEEELRNSQEMFEKAFHASPNAFIIAVYATGEILQVNEGFEKILAYTAEEALGRSSLELGIYDNPDDRPRIRELIAAQGSVRNIAVNARNKFGEIRNCLVSYEQIEIKGEPCLVSVVHDITEQKRAEEALKSSEANAREFQNMLRELLEISLELSRIDDLLQLYQQAVVLGRERLGYDRMALFLIDLEKDMIYGTFGTDTEGILRDERHLVRQLSADWAMNQVVQEGRRSYIWEDVSLNQDWQEIGKGWNGLAVLWDGDKSIGTIAVDNLLTQVPIRPYERELLDLFGAVLGYLISGKQTEVARQEMVQRLQMINGIDRAILMAASPRAIAGAVVERLERLLYCDYVSVFSIDNESRMLHLLAWSVGDTALEDFPLDDAKLLDLPRLRKGLIVSIDDMESKADLSRTEQVLLDWGIKSFAVIPLRVDEILVGTLNIGMKSKGGISPAALSIADDISTQLSLAIRQARLTEEVQAYASDLETQVRYRTIQLEAKNTELEAFTYSVSHDLRSPLRAMSGFAEVLLDDFAAEVSEEARYYLERIQHNANRMGSLIDDLLALSRVGRRELIKKRLNPKTIIEEVIEDLRHDEQLEKAKISLEDMPECEADPVLLKQVWFNLISNAIKYRKKGETPEIKIGAKEENGATVYYIQDEGVGFDMSYADKLFGVFQRLHNDNEYEGTGIGLATVHRIIERHEGRIWAEAKPNQGASFYFTTGR